LLLASSKEATAPISSAKGFGAGRSGNWAIEAWRTRTGIYDPVHNDRIGLLSTSVETVDFACPPLFDIAWSDYFGEARSGLLPEGRARSMLANYLVARAKEGTRDELTMAAAGFAHLISLTLREINDVSRGATTQLWKLNYKRYTRGFTIAPLRSRC
jgi:hypothetical protein